ncbi:hypothetical protein LNN31_11710 [Acetobacterium wieringae]|jgi:hypothetical protein|uniref:Uncharacterized protein n=1 Tax=Acetobacterium wieringae TaxID=52694 RepID=A0A1F2PIE7_9FIRM|nr:MULTISPECIES: hypothetical protein [Acetobacterium]OFV70642.1 hypothetical protein ACWI_18540 [Acetobacterium wieringae]TYC88306.1 hypothetical protein FXB42_01440 [Acetobacterium wieringae]UYO61448.1 hypothetical protein LNN31_11710 [Acetobacterium wieringae]VUZ28596.1 Uncharacterised protein [Acetobacterium wieringae]
MRKRLFIVCILFLSIATLVGCIPTSEKESDSLGLESTDRYELLIGLNDVSTGKQIMDTQEAIEIIKMKLLNHVSGVTLTVSNGYYYIGALIVDETTLNCVIYGANDESITALVDEINKDLNVSVLVSKTPSKYRLITP